MTHPFEINLFTQCNSVRSCLVLPVNLAHSRCSCWLIAAELTLILSKTLHHRHSQSLEKHFPRNVPVKDCCLTHPPVCTKKINPPHKIAARSRAYTSISAQLDAVIIHPCDSLHFSAPYLIIFQLRVPASFQ